MKRGLLLAAIGPIGLFVSSSPLVAATTAPAPAPLPEVKQWQLANGLNVFFLPEHKAPVVTAQVFYHAGSKDEPPTKRGIAHMFEHMMFKGSKHVPPEAHARFVDAVGGSENAFTADDLTCYHDTVPPSSLELVIKLEAERMRNLLLTPKTINSEREVVKEEYRMRVEQSPVMKAFNQVLHLAYTVHPYKELAVGEPRMLDTVTVADCRAFYDTWYRPNNATLVVVGDTDEATVRRLADTYFGPIERGPVVAHQTWNEPQQTERKEATMKMPVRLPVVIGAYHIPAGASDDIYPLEVLQEILSNGESSRLYRRLVHKDHSAVYAGGFVFAKEDPGLFIFYSVFLPSGDPARVKAALADEVARVTRDKVDARELEKAKNQLAARAVAERERVAGIATRIGSDAIVNGDPLRQFRAPARYDAVTADDVLRVAKTWFVDSAFSQVTLVPEGGKGPAAATAGGAK